MLDKVLITSFFLPSLKSIGELSNKGCKIALILPKFTREIVRLMGKPYINFQFKKCFSIKIKREKMGRKFHEPKNSSYLTNASASFTEN
jgi:hypothetical protein